MENITFKLNKTSEKLPNIGQTIIGYDCLGRVDFFTFRYDEESDDEQYTFTNSCGENFSVREITEWFDPTNRF